ncbi:MAG: DNA repair protein [Firmicutes bacterium]|nr:DNA repair protein [Bacillota bacterium]
MTQREVRKLKRADLLELLIEQRKQIEQLQEELIAANIRLSDRTIQIEKTGSIAEAALKLNGIFEAAQKACDQYTYNIQLKSEQLIKNEKETVE